MAGDSAREFARRQREKAARLERSAELWERGADGEAQTGAALDQLRLHGWTTFHDVRWPGRQRANIDHVVVGPGGVFVVDSKNWSGVVRVVGDVLYQGSRRREREVAAAADAALAITQFLQGLPATPVLCFVRPEPIDGWARDVMVCSTQNLAARLAAQPPTLGPESMRRVSSILERHLASAVRPTPVRSRRVRSAPSQRRPRRTRKILLSLLGVLGGLVFMLFGLAVVLGLLGSIVGTLGEGAGAKGPGGPGAQTSSAPTFGDVVHLAAGSTHPALELRADKVMRVETTRPELQPQDRHLVGVRYSIRNMGSQFWGATSPYLQFSALTSDGQHAPPGSYVAMSANRLMPAAFNLRPGKTRRGFVVFSIPNGAKLVRVSVQTGFGSSEVVEWLIP